jgi:hypothetical protein
MCSECRAVRIESRLRAQSAPTPRLFAHANRFANQPQRHVASIFSPLTSRLKSHEPDAAHGIDLTILEHDFARPTPSIVHRENGVAAVSDRGSLPLLSGASAATLSPSPP